MISIPTIIFIFIKYIIYEIIHKSVNRNLQE